jgi:hypothetical protein
MTEVVAPKSEYPSAGVMRALLAVQAEAPKLQKDKINPAFRSKYLSLDALMEQVLPLLNKHGLVWTTAPCFARPDSNDAALGYVLTHAATGSEIRGIMPLLLSKQDAQGLGSAITYARRYSLMAVLGLVADEDDDGAKASQRAKRPPAPVEQPTQVVPKPNGGSSRLLTADELDRTLKAIEASGHNQGLVFASVGLSGPVGMTVEHAREIKKRIRTDDEPEAVA